MPNTKSAERRMRSSTRKHARNHSIKSNLHSLEKKFLGLVKNGKKEEAVAALRNFSSAFDKAAKVGVVHRGTASRKKSRLALRLNSVKG
jgi:small subunit ribosomal protein S20